MHPKPEIDPFGSSYGLSKNECACIYDVYRDGLAYINGKNAIVSDALQQINCSSNVPSPKQTQLLDPPISASDNELKFKNNETVRLEINFDKKSIEFWKENLNLGKIINFPERNYHFFVCCCMSKHPQVEII